MVFAPSLVEVEDCGLLPLVRGGVWFVSLFGRGDLVVVWLRAYPSVVRRCLREEFGTPSVVTVGPKAFHPSFDDD